MKTNRCSLLPVLGALIALVSYHPANAAPFTPGNLAVVRVGDGAVALSSAATATFIDEYTSAGFLVQSIAIPASGPVVLTMSGSATSEGALMRSPNGALLCFGGYNAASGTAVVATTTSALVNREIGTVDASGSFAVAASTATQFNTGNIRSGATDGTNSFWGGGNGSPASGSGINYLGTAAGASQILSGNLRCVNIFNGDLYFSSGAATPGNGIHQFSGLPVIAAASTPLTVVANQSPYGFSINPTGTVMYVADDRAIASGGGIQRWDKAGVVWSLTYTLGTGGGSTFGTRGLVVNWSGASPVVYATTTEANNNRLIAVSDTGPASFVGLVTSVGANKAFRGLAYAPLSQRVPKPRFFTTNFLPPSNGVYASGPEGHAIYGNGLIIRNVSHKKFAQSLPPPPLGGTQLHSFDSMVEMDVSSDGGVSFQHVSAPANTSVSVTHTSDDATTNRSFYDTEMLQLNIVGGLLPAGVMVRESPTRASTGKTVTQGIGGGFMIDSFFDVFTELSLDGGQSWSPALNSVSVDLTIDSTQITPISVPSNLWPPPNNCFASTAQNYVTFPLGIVIRGMRNHFFTQSLPPPALGLSQMQTLNAQIDMEVSIDGGQTFGPARAPASMTIQVTHSRDEGTTQIFETEMLQLDIAGGDMPIGVMLRESPSKQSRGGTAYAVPSVGDPDFDLLRIGSFFDIFVELSVDGGQNWSPATSPGHVELQCNAPELAEPSGNLPPLGDEYASNAAIDAAFAGSILIKGTKLDEFSESMPAPPPGGSQLHSPNARMRFMLSQDGGQTFNPMTAPASVAFQVTRSVDSGGTRYFDTEMLALNISGGSLPIGVMVRESPSKASLGRTSMRLANDPVNGIWAYVGSFFDIFVELSVDGGATWQPSTIGPMEIVLSQPLLPAGTPHFFSSNVLPPANGVDASEAGSVFATYANGIIVQGVSHKMFSQSLPPPPPGGGQVHNFSSTVLMDVSVDGGQSFQRVAAPANVTMRVTHAAANATTSFFDTEMLALNISGGSLPAGVMIRESPSKASLGRTSIETVGAGYMIGSFFDIFTEISLDGGQNWSPSALSGHLIDAPDPTLIAPIQAPSGLFPPPNDFFASTTPAFAQFAQGIVLRKLKHRLFTPSLPPPGLGQNQVHNFDAQIDVEVSQDGGQTFLPIRVPAAASVRLSHPRDEGTTQIFDTEMLQLDLAGGGLPAGVMLRESPTRQSQGGTAILLQTNGTHRIHSFFDIFTEISLDGGQNWSPTQVAGHVELQCDAPEVAETSPNLPPLGDEYLSIAEFDMVFAAGIIIKETKLDRFTQSLPPPAPGGTQQHTFDSRLRFSISVNGGATFTPVQATASSVLRVEGFGNNPDNVCFYDTEMLSLNVSGGSLPLGVMLRESPSKASLGRTSIRQIPGGYMVSSFFDIFTELSVDGGQTWMPSLTSPMELVLHDADTDDDGLPDEWELAYFGDLSHGPKADADGDGASNREEFIAGTDPTNPTSVLRLSIARLGPNLLLRFPTVAGHRYTLQSNTGLIQPWLPVAPDVQGDGTVRTILEENPFVDPRRFYRLEVNQSP